MFVNLNIIPAALLGVVLFFAGRFLDRRLTYASGARRGGGAAGVCCLPGLMFLAYYLHLFGEPIWYIRWRSIPYTEVLSALCAPLGGFLSARLPCLFPAAKGLCRLPVAMLTALLVFVPFAKPVLLPVAAVAHWSEQWHDGVCLQTAYSTCGPASLATIFYRFGMQEGHGERTIARACCSSASGTEIWYLLRYLRQQGLPYTCRHETNLHHIVFPALVGTRLGNVGHFVVLLNDEDGRVTIGDPMVGRTTFYEDEFSRRFTGCVLDIHKP